MNKTGKLLLEKLRGLWMKDTDKLKEQQKLNLYISTLVEVFLNQKTIHACEHTVKMSPRDSFE